MGCCACEEYTTGYSEALWGTPFGPDPAMDTDICTACACMFAPAPPALDPGKVNASILAPLIPMPMGDGGGTPFSSFKSIFCCGWRLRSRGRMTNSHHNSAARIPSPIQPPTMMPARAPAWREFDEAG